MDKIFDLAVIGSGPGGYVAAIRAAQLGMDVAVIEKSEVGGVCLNWGCIPTKALLTSAQVYNNIKNARSFGIEAGEYKVDFPAVIARSREVADKMSRGIDYLFKKNKITLIRGTAKFRDAGSLEVTTAGGQDATVVQAKNIIVATGSKPKTLPNIALDGKFVISYKEAMTLDRVPQKLLIIGGGAIGVEFAFFYNSMGAEVTLVEFLPQGLLPNMEKDISRVLKRAFKKQGIEVLAPAMVQEVSTGAGKCHVHIKDLKKETLLEKEADKVLMAVGVKPATGNLGLEQLGVKLDRGYIVVDDSYKTTVDNIYAIGDVINTPALAHVASAEAINCVEKIAGLNPGNIDYGIIPFNVYCSPAVASAGMTTEQAKEKYPNVKTGKFPFTASGKATAAGETEGFVKLIFDGDTNRMLGAHLTGHNVTELISEAVLIMKEGITADQLIKTIHPHPTMSEGIMEAAAAAYGEAIHL